jgi:hypothetical protein
VLAMAPNSASLTDASRSLRCACGVLPTARLWILPWLLICLTACVPSTKATIRLGHGYAATEMDRVEAVVEKAGFTRRVFDGPRATAHRMEKDGNVVSAFEAAPPRRFGASVSWTRADGSLAVDFAEYDTQLSSRGQTLLQNLRTELQAIYGERVIIDGPI